MNLQNRPALTVEASGRARTIDFANTAGKISPSGFAGLDSVIQGGDLNAFPQAALSLLQVWFAQIPMVSYPFLPGVGRLEGFEYVTAVDPGPEGFASFDERGDRIYVWTGDDWYFGTWFGRWYKDSTQNPLMEQSSVADSIPISIPSGTLFNGASWQAGDVLNPEGAVLVPDDEEPSLNGDSFPGSGLWQPPAPDLGPNSSNQSPMQQVWIAAGLVGLAGFLFFRRKR